jgi:hypothetical protein
VAESDFFCSDDKGAPVALLVPIRARDREEISKTLTRSARIAWAGGKPSGLAKRPKLRGRSVSEAVREDRRGTSARVSVVRAACARIAASRALVRVGLASESN